MSDQRRPADYQGAEGLSNERTALAWQRTALSLTVAAIAMGRVTFERLGGIAAAALTVAALLSAWVFVESRLRYSTHHAAARRGRPRGGRAALALTTATTLIALTEIAALVRGIGAD
ncbi:DUF202 domain-containing protein [Nocardioides sp. GY 10113]|uniref:DUF202 domain-containing protein n=1 Tax=Nocardioides sp. GY 10113 TaxID=2569761 RepID=UPI0010A87914|nr:DUF202 domain-containing protein [Nocardioides sp. GY 10113]TIC88829.1 DUF202 domain-containing protein [Nocardioides sp. GY 10113]